MHALKRILTLLPALLLVAGCAGGEDGAAGAPLQAGEGLVVTDMTGREVRLDGPARRVVALTAADCEIVFALGEEAVLVGRGEYCDYPAAALEIQAVASGSESNTEQIIALAPDAVIVGTMDQSLEQLEQLETAGIPVVITDAQDIAGVYDAIALIGRVLGVEEYAQLVADGMRDSFDVIVQEIADVYGDVEKGTVYFEVSPLEYGLWTTGRDTFMNEVAEMLGLRNIFDDVSGWVQVSQEQVIERDPDYIVTVSMYLGEGPRPEEEILVREAWQGMTAVQNRTVFHAGSDEITRPGPRLVEAAQQLFEQVYTPVG